MNLYKIYNDEEDTPEVTMPENPMEKMMSSWQFDKKFIEQRKLFLWGVVDDKSAKDIKAVLEFADVILVAIPAQTLRENLESWKGFFPTTLPSLPHLRSEKKCEDV